MVAEPALPYEEDIPRPDISHLVMEDDEPMDNFFQEKQQRLLTTSLYASGALSRPFLAAANVGLFSSVQASERIVPDVMVSLDVETPEDLLKDEHRSYLLWEFGKPPDLVIEIISNRREDEKGKGERYARIGVPYYAVYDPRGLLGKRPLKVFELHARRYVDVMDPGWLPDLGLGLTLWTGVYEESQATWLRWVDGEGTLLLTGEEQAGVERERAEQAERRAEQERERAEQERERAEQERERAERLRTRLRELGVDED